MTELTMTRHALSDFGQSAERAEWLARRKLARKARTVFRNAPRFLDALEAQVLYVTERTAARYLDLMPDKASVQRATRAAIKAEASRRIAELEAIIEGGLGA